MPNDENDRKIYRCTKNSQPTTEVETELLANQTFATVSLAYLVQQPGPGHFQILPGQ